MDNQEMRDINSIVVGERHRKDLGDIKGLAQSISDFSLFHPIVVKSDGQLIAGQRRLEACKSLGWTKIPVRVIDIRDVTRGEADENAVRKDLTPSEAVAIAKALEPEIKKDVGERQTVQIQQKPEPPPGGNLPPPRAKKTRDKLAGFVGMSGRTLEKATRVVDAAQQDPEKYGRLLNKMDETGKVDGAFRELRRLQAQTSVDAAVTTSEKGKSFSIVLAIPPWEGTEQDNGAVADKKPSQVISLKEMKRLSLPIAVDAVLFLQTPPASLPSALELLSAWGFTYKTLHIWPCLRRSHSRWFTEIHHIGLFGVRGNHATILPENLVPSIIPLNPLQPISKAPTIYDRIEKIFPGEKYLEVFTQCNRPGWMSWPANAKSDERLEKTMPGNTTMGSS